MNTNAPPLQQAQQALLRLRPALSEHSVNFIEQRLAQWSERAHAVKQVSTSLPELVMRPGLPPRPLHKHYFTVSHSYE